MIGDAAIKIHEFTHIRIGLGLYSYINKTTKLYFHHELKSATTHDSRLTLNSVVYYFDIEV